MLGTRNRRQLLEFGLAATLSSVLVGAGPSAQALDAQAPVEGPSSTDQKDGDGLATEPAVLWQGLAVGMSPEQAATILQAHPGVKKARPYRRRANDNSSQLKISYTEEKIQIRELPFTVEPRFLDKRLDQVWLASTDQCSVNAVALLRELSTGLSTKYTEVIFEEEFNNVDLSRANRNARRSGEPVRVSRIYGSKDIVVVLTAIFSAESPPPYPGSGNRFALSLYELARNNYRLRAQECGGTGNRRMDVALQYMTRSAFDARAAEVAEEMRDEQAELLKQL